MPHPVNIFLTDGLPGLGVVNVVHGVHTVPPLDKADDAEYRIFSSGTHHVFWHTSLLPSPTCPATLQALYGALYAPGQWAMRLI